MRWAFAGGDYAVVAIRTRQRRVVFVGSRTPGRHVVTIVARRIGQFVPGMGRSPIVLIGALHVASRLRTGSRHHADMIPACRYPGVGSVALVAGIAHLRNTCMVGRSGRGLPAVVATQTLPLYRGTVVESCAEKGGRIEVTGFTGCVRHDMVGRFGGCDDAFSQRMATIAGLGRAFEYAAQMTCLARCRSVPAG